MKLLHRMICAGLAVLLVGCSGDYNGDRKVPARSSLSGDPSAGEEPVTTSLAGVTLTLANYQKLKSGMTREEVEAILGPGSARPPQGLPGSDVTPGGPAPGKVYFYWWTNHSVAAVGFIDGKSDINSMVMHH